MLSSPSQRRRPKMTDSIFSRQYIGIIPVEERPNELLVEYHRLRQEDNIVHACFEAYRQYREVTDQDASYLSKEMLLYTIVELARSRKEYSLKLQELSIFHVPPAIAFTKEEKKRIEKELDRVEESRLSNRISEEAKRRRETLLPPGGSGLGQPRWDSDSLRSQPRHGAGLENDGDALHKRLPDRSRRGAGG